MSVVKNWGAIWRIMALNIPDAAANAVCPDGETALDSRVDLFSGNRCINLRVSGVLSGDTFLKQ
jgi:hypothetical protein